MSKPNVLFISFDDLNHYAGFIGRHPDAVTPHMNELAERSMVFERAYCQAPICNPSRASLMSGLLPSTTGVYGNRQPLRFSDVGRDAVTLPQHFRLNGYRATGSGKVYHGKFPDPLSWDEYVPNLYNQSHSQIVPKQIPANGMKDMGNVDWGPLDAADEEMQDYKAVSYSIEQLGKTHDKPFFLTCGFKLPHLGWYAPREYFEMFDPEEITLPHVLGDDLEDVPPAGRDLVNLDINERILEAGKWGEAQAAYLACIRFVDRQIGRLLSALNQSTFAENTIVILWADHGWHLGEKLHWKKSTLWEEATRVPLLISDLRRSAGRCTKPVGLIDIYPTLIDLCTLQERDELEGQSLAPLLADPEIEWTRPATTTHGRGNHSVRSDEWRYIRYADGSEELYDHQRDEMELNNLSPNLDYREVKQELARWIPGHDAPNAEVVTWPDDNEVYRERIEEMLQPK